MSHEDQRESLSALVDGELAPAQAQRLIDAVTDDAELRAQWRRHHVISAVLSGHTGATADVTGIADRVRDALDREPVVFGAAQRRSSRRWFGWAAAAAAASVAAVAVLLVTGLPGDARRDLADPVAVAPAPQRSPAPAPARTAVRVASGDARETLARPVAAARPGAADPLARTRLTWNDAAPGVEARLNGYLLNHNEYLSGGVRGMLPYARVVGYDGRN